MLAFRYFAAIGTGAALALGYAHSSAAQALPASTTETEPPVPVPVAAAPVIPTTPTPAQIDALAARDEVAVERPQPLATADTADRPMLAATAEVSPVIETIATLTQRQHRSCQSPRCRHFLQRLRYPPSAQPQPTASALVTPT
ncbi:MAG: hypothetical protein HC910_14100, partial [Spirulinaceae cyanobacterium SM2_1_0]|nr:hypothetical protein [Spirulinaceae cyanobacterium SM2_1_0]